MPRCTSLCVPEAGFLGQRVWALWQLTVKIALEFLLDSKLKWPHTVKVRVHCYLLFPKGLDSWLTFIRGCLFFFFSTCRKQKSIHTSSCRKGVESVILNLKLCSEILFLGTLGPHFFIYKMPTRVIIAILNMDDEH